MKKNFIFLFLLIILLSGCSNSISNNSDSSVNNNQKESIYERPAEEADVVGIVDSISGNEIVILKMEIKNRNQGQGMILEGSKFEDGINENEKEDDKILSLSGITRMSGGMGGGLGRSRESMDEDAQLERLERIKSMSSGSEIVIIPVGIKMLKMDLETRKMVEADLTDIESNQMLSVWLNEKISDRNIADFVLIR